MSQKYQSWLSTHYPRMQISYKYLHFLALLLQGFAIHTLCETVFYMYRAPESHFSSYHSFSICTFIFYEVQTKDGKRKMSSLIVSPFCCWNPHISPLHHHLLLLAPLEQRSHGVHFTSSGVLWLFVGACHFWSSLSHGGCLSYLIFRDSLWVCVTFLVFSDFLWVIFSHRWSSVTLCGFLYPSTVISVPLQAPVTSPVIPCRFLSPLVVFCDPL